jgi:hypothetical protein
VLFLWLVVGFEPLPLPLPLFFFLWGFLAFAFFAAGLVDFFSEPPGAPAGGAWLEVVLVVVVDGAELDEDEDDEEEEEVVVLVVVVVVVVVVPVPDVHTSVIDATGRFAGTIEEI